MAKEKRIHRLTLLLFCSLLCTQQCTQQCVCQPGEDEQFLQIQSPLQVYESEQFYVQILLNNEPLANATVLFHNQIKYSNTTGYTSFIAPRVLPNETNTYEIIAYKNRLTPVSINISVENRPQLFALLEKTTMYTSTVFRITVVDDEGRLIENTTLFFNNKKYTTNKNGSMLLTTPEVNKSTVYMIRLEKNGYINNTLLVIVQPWPRSENIIGLYSAIGIFVGIAAFSIVVLMLRHFRRKRINRKK